MTRWVPIDYRDFWDVPRIFFAADGGELFLFDCPFDEETEDFPNDYRVYRMPPLTPDDLAGSWADLHRKAVRDLGTVPIDHVAFDPTKRKFIDGAILEEVAGPAVPLGEFPGRG